MNRQVHVYESLDGDLYITRPVDRPLAKNIYGFRMTAVAETRNAIVDGINMLDDNFDDRPFQPVQIWVGNVEFPIDDWKTPNVFFDDDMLHLVATFSATGVAWSGEVDIQLHTDMMGGKSLDYFDIHDRHVPNERYPCPGCGGVTEVDGPCNCADEMCRRCDEAQDDCGEHEETK